MAGKSTSQDVDLDMEDTNVSGVYNLQNWQGLTEVLKAAKEALTDTSEYASFRNLVLQYAQQGGDIEIKKKIIAQIATFSKPGEEKEHTDFLPHSIPHTVTGHNDAVAEEQNIPISVDISSEVKDESATEEPVRVVIPQAGGVVGTRRMPPRFVKVTPVPIPVQEVPVVKEEVAVPQSFLPESIVSAPLLVQSPI